jgi:Predicted transcriptional regulators
VVISLEYDSEVPMYEQLCDQIIIGIATGQLAEGEKLPTVRQLARELGINVMTVNKAYARLRQEGYIVIDRRHGAMISPRADSGEVEQHAAKLKRQLRLLIAQASVKGIGRAQFQQLCSEIYSQMAIQN